MAGTGASVTTRRPSTLLPAEFSDLVEWMKAPFLVACSATLLPTGISSLARLPSGVDAFPARHEPVTIQALNPTSRSAGSIPVGHIRSMHAAK